MEAQLQSNLKKLNDREAEVDTISCLYKETDRLYSNERQKNRQAK